VIELKDVNLSIYTKTAAATTTAPTGGSERPKSVAMSAVAASGGGDKDTPAGAFPLEIMAVKQVVGKDGTAGTAVTRLTLHCTTADQKQSLLAQFMEAADRVQSASRDLKERQLNAAPGRTRAWRKRSDMGTWGKSLKKGEVGGLSALQERYSAGGAVTGKSAGEVDGSVGELGEEGGDDGEDADDGHVLTGADASPAAGETVSAARDATTTLPASHTPHASELSGVSTAVLPTPSRRPLPAFPGSGGVDGPA